MEPVGSVGFFYLINKQHLLNLFSPLPRRTPLLKTPYPTTRKLIEQFHQITKLLSEPCTFYSPLEILIFSVLSSKNLFQPLREVKTNLNNNKDFLY